MNVTTHIIVGTLPDPANLSSDPSIPSIVPPHPYAAKTPFRTHTALSKPFSTGKVKKLTFASALALATDDEVKDQLIERSGNPATNPGGVEDATCKFFLM